MADPAATHSHDEVSRLVAALLESSTDLIIVVDDQADVVLISSGIVELLGYRPENVIGRSVFEFVHPDDVKGAADLFIQRLGYDGPDPGVELRGRHSSGEWLALNVTATILPSYAAAALTLRTSSEGGRERTLERRIAVTELASRIGTELMNAPDTASSLQILDDGLSEVGLITGAQVVAVYLERQDRRDLERIAGWQSPQSGVQPDTELLAEPDTVERLTTEDLVIDDLTDLVHEQLAGATRRFGAVSLLSAPFTTGDRRGVVLLLSVHHHITWWESDGEMARGMASHYGRVLRAAWSDELLALSYHHGPVAFVIRTWDGVLVECNQRYRDLVGQPEHVDRCPPGRPSLEEYEHLAPLRAGLVDRIEHEHEIERIDGTTIWVRSTSVPLHIPGSTEQFVMTATEDITERRRQRLALEHAATHDALTGVANRTTMWQRIDELAGRDGIRPALFIIDLDEFKMTNDVHGHAVGDAVLVQVTERLCRTVRKGDLVARLGGDEFAVVVPDTTVNGAADLGERFRRCFDDPLAVEGRSIRQTLSIGIALGVSRDDLGDLLVRADRALYTAKQAGRNQYAMFDETMRDAVLDTLSLERDLRQSVEDGNLELHYQPEYTVGDRRVVGAEALVRWNRPGHGLVSAGAFIPAAEEAGLIGTIGSFVITRATGEFAEMCRRAGRDDLVLRINVAPGEFGRTDLPDQIEAALGSAGLDPSRLLLDVTVATLVRAPESTHRTIERLRDIGVRLAIDNFGASALTQLRRFPAAVVSIDRSFVADLVDDKASRSIVESVVNLCRSLGLATIAEGVETDDQLAALAEIGCERFQGHLLSAAVPAEAFEAFLAC